MVSDSHEFRRKSQAWAHHWIRQRALFSENFNEKLGEDYECGVAMQRFCKLQWSNCPVRAFWVLLNTCNNNPNSGAMYITRCNCHTFAEGSEVSTRDLQNIA